MRHRIAALTLSLLAFPAAASATHAAPAGGTNPGVESHLPAAGTDVAAPDQQAPIRTPAPAGTPSSDDFDWADAGLGAAGLAGLAGISLASGMTLRHRRNRGGTALAG